jgi:hypothetical protein
MVDLPRDNVDRRFEIRRTLCCLPDPKFLLPVVYFVRLTSVVPSQSPTADMPTCPHRLHGSRSWPRRPSPISGDGRAAPRGCARPRCSYGTPSSCTAALAFSPSPSPPSPTRPERQRLAAVALRSSAPGPAPTAWPRASSPRQESLRSKPRTAAAAEQIGDGRGAATISSSMLSHFPTTRSTCHCFPCPGRRQRWLPCYWLPLFSPITVCATMLTYFMLLEVFFCLFHVIQVVYIVSQGVTLWFDSSSYKRRDHVWSMWKNLDVTKSLTLLTISSWSIKRSCKSLDSCLFCLIFLSMLDRTNWCSSV